MKRFIPLGVFVAIACALATAHAAKAVPAKVVRVTSGDQLVVVLGGKEKKITLGGIDAPEKGQAFGDRAKQALSTKVAGKNVQLQPLAGSLQKTSLAAVWIDDRSINKELVAEGWAWHDPRFAAAKTLAKAEKEARDKKLGLWSEDDPTPPWLWRASADGSQDIPVPGGDVKTTQATSKAQELAQDDGKPAGRKSFPRGHAVQFESPAGDSPFLTAVRVHGARYGHPRPPRENFHVTLCDTDFNPIADFTFPYARFPYGKASKWVTLKVKPTKVPPEFVICLNFNAERTKGVYVSHDAEGTSLVGLPKRPAGRFTGGNWLIRAMVQERPSE